MAAPQAAPQNKIIFCRATVKALAQNQDQSEICNTTWVHESRFGMWFQGTTMWSRYVLGEALDRLADLIGQPLPDQASILDAGCGEGKALPKLQEIFAPKTIVGMDIDAQLTHQAKAVAQDVGCPVEILTGNIANTSLPEKSIDIILCHQVLHHVSDQEATLAEFRRVLKPDGLLLLAESCRSFTHSHLVRVLFRHAEDNQRTAEGYLALLSNAGFVVQPDSISTPDVWWARPGMGLLRLLKIPHADRPTPLLLAIARSG
jgi:2-polyprenyl-3-methyl-5-hydroxy-6-metoxy-1,4-benzoquinol methylase